MELVTLETPQGLFNPRIKEKNLLGWGEERQQLQLSFFLTRILAGVNGQVPADPHGRRGLASLLLQVLTEGDAFLENWWQ